MKAAYMEDQFQINYSNSTALIHTDISLRNKKKQPNNWIA